jgi:hypothetical protein
MIRYMRWTYFGWLGLISAAIVLQLYLAGYGVFGFNGLNGFGPHLFVGDLIGIATVVAVGLAFAARLPWRLTGMSFALLALIAIQFVLAHAGVQIISALHVINGVLIFGLTLYLTREAWRTAMKQLASGRHRQSRSASAPIEV